MHFYHYFQGRMTRSTSSSAGFTNGNSTCENNRLENNGHCSVNEIEPMGASYGTLKKTSLLEKGHIWPLMQGPWIHQFFGSWNQTLLYLRRSIWKCFICSKVWLKRVLWIWPLDICSPKYADKLLEVHCNSKAMMHLICYFLINMAKFWKLRFQLFVGS